MRLGEAPELLVHRWQWPPARLIERRNLVPRRLHPMASTEFMGNKRLERIQNERLQALVFVDRTKRARQFHQARAFRFVESCHRVREIMGMRPEKLFGSRKFAARTKKLRE